MKKQVMMKLICIALCASLVTTTAFAAEGTTANDSSKNYKRQETVYLITDPNGNVQNETVSAWVHSDNGIGNYSESTNLTDVKNVKGDDSPTLDGKELEWNNISGDDLYYQGKSSAQAPVTMKVDYKLDGKEISADQLAGKTGKLEMTVSFQNHEKATKLVGGESRTIYTPFLAAALCSFSTDHFQNVKCSEGGAVVSEGNSQIVTMISLPGMKETLGSSVSTLESLSKINLEDSFTITADATNLEMNSIMGAALPAGSESSNGSFSFDVGQIDSLVDQMESASGQLSEGSEALASALSTYNNKMLELQSGVEALNNGISSLNSGATELAGGTQQLSSGSDQLASGTEALSTGAKQVKDGSSAFAQGITQLDGSVKQLSAGSDQAKDGAAALQAGLGEFTTALQQVTGSLVDSSMQQISTDMSDPNKPFVQSLAKAGSDTQDIGATLQTQNADLIKNLQGIAATTTDATTKAQINAMISGIQNNTTVGTKLTGLGNDIQAIGQGANSTLTGSAQTIKSNFAGQEKKLNESAQKLNDGAKSVADGTKQISDNLALVSGGVDTLMQKANELAAGAQQVSDGAESAKNGADSLKSGSAQVNAGASALQTGATELQNGGIQLQSGIGQLTEAAGTLAEKSGELSTGANQFKVNGIDLVANKVVSSKADAEKLLDLKDAILDQAKSYKTFSGTSDGCSNHVSFIMKTNEIKQDDSNEKLNQDAAVNDGIKTKTDQSFWARIKSLF